MTPEVHFRINTPRVVHETIDGEVVAIDLSTGSYFSLMAAGASIWALIDGGLTVTEMAEELAGMYRIDGGRSGDAVSGLVEDLRREGLIVEATGPPAQAGAAAGNGDGRGALDPPAGDPGPFQPPKLEKFEDMRDLILLDPVHEVDAASGWPHADGRDD